MLVAGDLLKLYLFYCRRFAPEAPWSHTCFTADASMKLYLFYCRRFAPEAPWSHTCFTADASMKPYLLYCRHFAPKAPWSFTCFTVDALMKLYLLYCRHFAPEAPRAALHRQRHTRERTQAGVGGAYFTCFMKLCLLYCSWFTSATRTEAHTRTNSNRCWRSLLYLLYWSFTFFTEAGLLAPQGQRRKRERTQAGTHENELKQVFGEQVKHT